MVVDFDGKFIWIGYWVDEEIGKCVCIFKCNGKDIWWLLYRRFSCVLRSVIVVRFGMCCVSSLVMVMLCRFWWWWKLLLIWVLVRLFGMLSWLMGWLMIWCWLLGRSWKFVGCVSLLCSLNCVRVCWWVFELCCVVIGCGSFLIGLCWLYCYVFVIFVGFCLNSLMVWVIIFLGWLSRWYFMRLMWIRLIGFVVWILMLLFLWWLMMKVECCCGFLVFFLRRIE